MFTKATLEVLKQAGWTEDRLVDTREYEEVAKAEGFVINNVAIEFLRHFGGLRLIFPHFRVPGKDDDAYFDPAYAARQVAPGWIDVYSRTVGSQLSLIGMSSRDYLVLTMSDTGRVYAGYDSCFSLVGESGVDAIESLCTGREPQEIPLKRDNDAT